MEPEAIERMRDLAPQLFDLVIQYRNDLWYRPSPDSINRRLDAINDVINRVMSDE